jgi:lipoprotein-releasing system ATP-binding protein
MLSVVDLRKEYSSPGGSLQVLNGVSLELDAGGAVAVMGPSGSGKSTLLQILGVLDNPTSGQVRIAGQDPFSLDLAAQARFRNSTIGFVFQDHCLLPQLTVLENVLVPLLAGEPDATAEARARALLEEMGLAARLDHKPAELSGGEKQRTAIARALIRQPALLLCDEPTGNLDRHSAELVASCLETARVIHRAALVVVTHSTELAARFPARLMLRDGRLAPAE